LAILKIYGDIVQEKLYDSDVTAESVKDFISNLGENEALDVYINSYGGEVHAGLAIYRTIKAHKGTKKVHIDGMACSIASVIAFAGDELIVPESSIMMIHLPYTAMVGNKLQFQEMIKTLETIESSMMTIYTNNLRKQSDKSKIQEFLEQEKWFNADEVDQYFKVTLLKDSEGTQAKTGILKKFKQSAAADPAEAYKQEVLRKLANKTQNRIAKNTRSKTAEAKRKAPVLTALKKGAK
jgi:ATP-dependent Clp protease, protease subunit